MFEKFSGLALAVAMGLALVVGSVAPASAAAAGGYSITVKYVEKSDTVWGTAKNVGGTWVVTLEWRKTKKGAWQALAQSDEQKGKNKARVGNVVHSPGFDFSGQWRTCVLKNPYQPNEKKTCGKVLAIE